MKKTSLLLLAVAAAAPAFAASTAVTLNLYTLPDSALASENGVVIGSNAKTAGTTQSNAVTSTATYDTLSPVLTTDLSWYSNVGSETSSDISGIVATPNAATIVTDGPSSCTHVKGAAFALTLSSELVDTLDTSSVITLTFGIAVTTGNNNQTTQSIQAQLLSSKGVSNVFTYANTSGKNTAAGSATLTLGADTVAALAATGEAQKLIVLFSDPNDVNGTNEGWTVSNLKLNYTSTVPEPATATLSLLALAGLAARRRRH